MSALVWTLAVTTGARAATLYQVGVVCPVCENAFEAVGVQQADQAGGIDRDLFARSVGSQPVCYLVTTCPRCYFSGYLEDYQEPKRVDAALRERVLGRPGLQPSTPIARTAEQQQIPAALKYELASTVAEWRRASAEARGWIFLRWSWVVREEGSFLPPCDETIRAMRWIESEAVPRGKDGNQADREVQAATLAIAALQDGRVAPELYPAMTLTAAMLLRRHGENMAAERLLTRFDKMPGGLPALRDGAAVLRRSIAEEQRLQRLALARFEEAHGRQEFAAANLAAAEYLMGELARRLGQPQRAARWYEAASRRAGIDASLRRWIDEQQELLADAPSGEPGK